MRRFLLGLFVGVAVMCGFVVCLMATGKDFQSIPFKFGPCKGGAIVATPKFVILYEGVPAKEASAGSFHATISGHHGTIPAFWGGYSMSGGGGDKGTDQLSTYEPGFGVATLFLHGHIIQISADGTLLKVQNGGYTLGNDRVVVVVNKDGFAHEAGKDEATMLAAAMPEWIANDEYDVACPLTTEATTQPSTSPGDTELTKAKEAYIQATLSKYLAWRPSKNQFDYPNPFHASLLTERDNVSLYVARNRNAYSRPVDLGLIWLLGEMGSPESFDMLLEEYRARPNYRSAVSLGACTGSSQIQKLLDALTDKELSAFLEDAFGKQSYSKIRGLSRQELLQYWNDHFVEVRKRCIGLSHPILG